MQNRRFFVLFLVLAFLLAACGGETDPVVETPDEQTDPDDTAEEEPGTADPGETLRVGMAIAGPRDDGGFFQGGYDGLVAASEKHGFEISIVENVEDSQAQLEALRNLATDGNDLVIGHSSAFSDPAELLAPQFPDTTFIVSAGVIEPAPDNNLHAYLVRQGVGSYVTGAVAATLTEANRVGFIGGVEIPPTIQSEIGFRQGVLDTDDSVDYRSTMIGTFNDPAAAKEAAEALIAAGVDVIYTFINAATPGVFQAIEESGADVRVMIAPTPRCDQFDGAVGTKFMNTVGLVDQMVEDYLNDELPGGMQLFGVENPNVQRVELCPGHEDPELQQIIDETTRQINDGEIELPEGI